MYQPTQEAIHGTVYHYRNRRWSHNFTTDHNICYAQQLNVSDT